ncbi:MAG: DUF1045 domain-containing protein [Pseudomonadota bacterium]
MTDYTRYAVYFAPDADSALARFGAAWLGWDVEARAAVAHPDLTGLPRSVDEITSRPRKYGFHGTLKPPLVLAPGKSPGEFETAVAGLAGTLAPIAGIPFALRRLGSFLALVPARPSGALRDLAAACVQRLDAFRAPPSEAELAKRRQHTLSPRQAALLAQWGYPYVLDEFRFHLTLSGPLAEAEAEMISGVLARHLDPILAAPLPVREICLFGEALDGKFHLLRRFPLGG